MVHGGAVRAVDPARRSGISETVIIGALAVLAAGLMVFSKAGERPNADTLLPVLISTQRVTWYYWGQNRLGSLWPLVAAPISDVYLNLVVQQVLKALMAALSPLFLLQLIRPAAAPLRAAFAVALAAPLLVLRPSVIAQFWMEAQPYGTSITLVAFAMLALRAPLRWQLRTLLAFALVMIATWVNLGIVVVTVPVFALFALAERRLHHFVLLAASVVAFLIVSRHAAHFPNAPAYAAFKLKLSMLAELGPTVLKCFLPDRAVGLAAVAAAVAAAIVVFRPGLKPELRRAGLVVLGCAAAMVITGLLSWFALNDYSTRYLALPLTLIVGAVAICALELLLAGAQTAWPQRVAGAAAAPLALLVVVLSFRPTLDPTIFDARVTEFTEKAIENGASFIAGDYWLAWPSVVAANVRGAGHPVYGLAFRGIDVIDKIDAAAVPGAVLVCAASSPAVCLDKVRSDLSRETLAGRPIDTMFEAVGSGTFGPRAEPFVVLRVRPE